MPTVPVRDLMMYYEEAGSGDPLVLIMGLGGDLQAWANQVPALAQHFRVITFDNRGAGRTSAPDRPYSIEQMAADTAALLDRLGIERAHVLGFSMGGYIAQELALHHPKRVGKLILLATAPDIDGFGRNVLRNFIDVRRSNLSREQFARFMATWLYSPELLDDERRLERAIAAVLANPYPQKDHGFIRQAEAILNWRPAGRQREIQHETLVVCGKDDILVPPRNSRRLAELLPKAKLVELPGAHVGCMEYPELYNPVFLEFLGVAAAAPAAS